ncbi:MAG TPA: hypothetical protein VGP92_16835 [Acidimicrobiia bacterium]|nr:hypothetical protein [Acidimicrobiia bacterium]
MARVHVRVDDLERGDLPALSVKTGVRCANPVAIVLRPEQRPWSPVGPKISAILPLEPRRARARRRSTRVTWILLVTGAAALGAALTGVGSAVLLLAAGALVAYLGLVLVGELRWVGSKPSDHDGEIVLTRVHRAFARAVDEQYRR